MQRAIWRQFVTSVRLQLRNPAALAYTYIVPIVFLGAFLTLYRHESPPLARHLDELLMVTALSGACFGLPAWLVSERERGVWRRYRLAPMPSAVHLIGMLGASYLLLLTAGALQIAAAAGIGTPLPPRIVDLWLAFTLASLAFLGIGLLIAMLADTVPAAQALGQVVFLPMLIMGGVAVPLESVPSWVQRVAAALPGRYAADAIEGALAGKGLAVLAPDATALAIMGAATGLASIAIFRWDAGQRVGLLRSIAPIGLAVGVWIAVGAFQPPHPLPPAIEPPAALALPEAPPLDRGSPPRLADARSGQATRLADARSGQAASSTKLIPPVAPPAPVERTWRDVTMDDVDVNLVFVGLPPDHGVVTPINAEYRRREDVECIRGALSSWAPAAVEDVVQRARNVLLLAAVPDVLQMDLERDVPFVVFDHLQQKMPKDQLVKVLYWIATHRSDGDLDALDEIAKACLDVQPPDDAAVVRERVGVYAMKLLGRITGRIK